MGKTTKVLNRFISAFLAMFIAVSPVVASPLPEADRWTASEAWSGDTHVYTLNEDGTFSSAEDTTDEDRGYWAVEGTSFAMFWPGRNETVFRGTLRGGEIRGNAFTRDGKHLGSMVLRPMDDSSLMPTAGEY
jgi:hypothetical protein